MYWVREQTCIFCLCADMRNREGLEELHLKQKRDLVCRGSCSFHRLGKDGPLAREVEVLNIPCCTNLTASSA